MTVRLAAGLALPLLLAACASVPTHDVRATPLVQTAKLNWTATDPHAADGVTAFAAARPDDLASKALEPNQTARTD